MSVIMLAAFLLLLLAIGAHWLWRNGQRHGLTEAMDLAYAHGTLDGFRAGDARGYTRGYSKACLDLVIEQPGTMAQHYAGIVGQLPDACDSAAFAEVLLNGGLREGLHEGAFPWEATS